MVVYRLNCTQLHLENVGRRFYDNTRGSKEKMAEGIIAYSKNSSLPSIMTNS